MDNNSFTECITGLLRPGDLVLSIPDDDYACLVGVVLEINKLGTPQHDQEAQNDTDNVHVDFYEYEYSGRRIKEIEAMFSKLYGENKAFEECPIDDVIMRPDRLIRINELEDEELEEILESFDNAAAYCKSVFREKELFDRLSQNLSDYHDSLLMLDKEDIIAEADMITSMSDAHCYLMEEHDFQPSEVDYLLKFENPLKVFADEWNEHVRQFDNIVTVTENVFDGQGALTGGYELHSETIPPEHQSTDNTMDIKQLARHEAERLLHEIKGLNTPNTPDGIHYKAKISQEFMAQAGFNYHKLLIEAFSPTMPIKFISDVNGDCFLCMRGGVRSAVKVVKPPMSEQMRDAAVKAAEHNERSAQDKPKHRECEVL